MVPLPRVRVSAHKTVPRAAAIPAAERRAQAVGALLLLARETAPERISTAAIAERMGVSHGALFRHFDSREAIWAEAVSWATAELERRFTAISEAATLQPSPGPGQHRCLEEVIDLLACHAAMLQEHPGLVRMLFAELQRPATSPARETGKAFMQRFRERLAVAIGRAQTGGDLDGDLDPADLASLLVATQQGLMLQALVHDGFATLVERSRHSVALLLRAFRRLPPQDAPATAPGA